MRRSTFRLAALCAAVAMLVLIPAGAALAHGHASQGDLEMEIGFATEPAYTGQPNADALCSYTTAIPSPTSRPATSPWR